MNKLDSELRSLGEVKAPGGFLERVLGEVGLADSFAPFDTVLGRVYVAWNLNGVSAAARSTSAESFTEWFREDVGRRLSPATPPEGLGRRIEDELAGRKTLRFDLRGLTEFERAVLSKTREIPRGEVRPYGWVAREIGHPAAVRAAGTALAHNPIPYLIPCHRVVRSDGVIGNYGGGGPEAKKQILGQEGVDVRRLEVLARAGVRYQGVRTTGVFCYPTCHHVLRAKAANVVPLRSGDAAMTAGFRPCRQCRPATLVS